VRVSDLPGNAHACCPLVAMSSAHGSPAMTGASRQRPSPTVRLGIAMLDRVAGALAGVGAVQDLVVHRRREPSVHTRRTRLLRAGEGRREALLVRGSTRQTNGIRRRSRRGMYGFDVIGEDESDARDRRRLCRSRQRPGDAGAGAEPCCDQLWGTAPGRPATSTGPPGRGVPHRVGTIFKRDRASRATDRARQHGCRRAPFVRLD